MFHSIPGHLTSQVFKKDSSSGGDKDEKSEEYVADISKLSHLEKSIDDLKKANGWKHVFLRMSIRSPKDAALSSKKFNDILTREFKSLQKFQVLSP